MAFFSIFSKTFKTIFPYIFSLAPPVSSFWFTQRHCTCCCSIILTDPYLSLFLELPFNKSITSTRFCIKTYPSAENLVHDIEIKLSNMREFKGSSEFREHQNVKGCFASWKTTNRRRTICRFCSKLGFC